MSIIKNKKSNKNKRLLVVVAIIAIALIIGAIIWMVTRSTDQDKSQLAVKNGPGGVNYSPPTEEEKQAGNDKKDEIVKGNESSTPQPPAGTATIRITYAEVYNDKLEVGAYVSNLLEDGGTCKLSLKKGGQEFTATVTAVKSASTTDCPVMAVNKSQLSAGTWTAVVTYSSAQAKGTSDTREITVN